MEKRWSDVSKNISTISEKNPKIIGNDIVLAKVKEYINDNIPEEDRKSYEVKDMKIVYSRKGEYSKIFVPAWEVIFENGLGHIHVDAITGNLIE